MFSQSVKAKDSRHILQHEGIGGSSSLIETADFLVKDGRGVSS